MSSDSTNSFDLALERIRSKSPIAARLSSADWASVELGLRDRAFFSSNIESIKMVSQLQAGIDKALAVPSDEVFMSRDRFIADMRQAFGAPEGDTGDLRDINSQARLGLIYDHQVEDAMEYGRWQAGQDPDLLDAFPCQELVRVESREKPRDWATRWAEAGGLFFGGRMIARKDSDIWVNLSRFGRPWPPFDFGSGMGVEDVSRDEAIELGVMSPEDTVLPQQKEFNAGLEASLPVATPEALAATRDVFGDQVAVHPDGKITWQGQRVLQLFRAATTNPSASWQLSLGKSAALAEKGIAGAESELWVTADTIRHIVNQHFSGNEDDPALRPMSTLDLQLIPHVWRQPDQVIPGQTEGSFELRSRLLGRNTVVVFDRGGKKGRWGVKSAWVHRKDKGATP